MRVRGNVSPNVLDIETFSPMPGYVEVRLRENIKAVPVVDENQKYLGAISKATLLKALDYQWEDEHE